MRDSFDAQSTGDAGLLIDEICDGLRKQGTWDYEWRLTDIPVWQRLKADKARSTAVVLCLVEQRDVLDSWAGLGSYTPHGCTIFGSNPPNYLFRKMMARSLAIPPERILDWIETLHANSRPYNAFEDWPIGAMMQSVERAAKRTPLSPASLARLRAMLDWPAFLNTEPSSYGTDLGKVGRRIRNLLGAAEGADTLAAPYKALQGDHFGDAVVAELSGLSAEEAIHWHRVFNLAATATASRPTKTFLRQGDALRESLGKEWLRRHLQHWITQALETAPIVTTHTETYEDRGRPMTWEYSEAHVYTKANIRLLKGLVWMAQGLRDARTVNLLADLCEKASQTIPGHGPVAPAIANAVMLFLEDTPGAQATARLARLGLAIKQPSTRARIAELVKAKAEAAGLTTIQLEERVVPDFGLVGGVREVDFDCHTLRIAVEGPGRITQTWLKPDGTVLKATPKAVTATPRLKARLKAQRDEIKAMGKVLTAQRDRIDRLLAEDLCWPLAEVVEHYLTQPLIACIATRLIWSLTTDGTTIAALWRDGVWEDVTGQPVMTSDTTRASLWHPVDESLDDVMAWRGRLVALQVTQPIKQAFREVYLLTDAERVTRTYSNRMAAHLLKQHQAAKLMAARGWSCKLMGAFDDGIVDQWGAQGACDLGPCRGIPVAHQLGRRELQ